ncbi:MAG: cysteine peptidase family C39 domain-containing protein [Bacteroidales bacterium]|nr:cysteine peptidase family C39 domain-containing protein [Bacteroidales bacterium]
MKIVQTFWNAKNEDLLKSNGGYLCPEINWMAWTYSCMQLHKFYPQIELYTDSRSKDFFKLLKLPYAQIHTTLDDNKFMKECLPDVWAYAKLDTYSHQNEPFLHVDGDVFINEPFPKELLSAPLVAQGFEENMDIYRETFATLDKYLEYKPNWFIEGCKESHAYNAGVIGGTDTEFFKHYVKTAQDLYMLNKKAIIRMKEDDENTNAINLIFEQHLYYSLAKEKYERMACVSDFVVREDLDNEYFYRVDDDWDYLHFMGNTKRMMYVNIFISRLLREGYPNAWEYIISLYTKGGMLSETMKHIIAIQNNTRCEKFIDNPEYELLRANRLQKNKDRLYNNYTEENLCKYLKESFFCTKDLDESHKIHPIFADIEKFEQEKFLLAQNYPKIVTNTKTFTTKDIYNKYIYLNPNFRIYETAYNWNEIYSFQQDETPFIRKKNEFMLTYIDYHANVIDYIPLSIPMLVLIEVLHEVPQKVADVLRKVESTAETETTCINNLRMLYYCGIIYLTDEAENYARKKLPQKTRTITHNYKHQVENCINYCCKHYNAKETTETITKPSIKLMLTIIKECGLDGFAAKIDTQRIKDIPTPAILLKTDKKSKSYSCFVLTGTKNEDVEIYDPIYDRINTISSEWINSFWDGKTILLQPQKEER